MIAGLYGKIILHKRRDYQPHLPFGQKRGMLKCRGAAPRIVHGFFDIIAFSRQLFLPFYQTVKHSCQIMFCHTVLIEYRLQGQRPFGHLLEKSALKRNAYTPSPVSVPLPLGGVIPVQGKAGGIGRVGKFLFQLFLEKFPHCHCPLRIPLLFQSSGDGIAQAAHKIQHFLRIIHIQHIVDPKLRAVQNAIQRLEIRIMIQNMIFIFPCHACHLSKPPSDRNPESLPQFLCHFSGQFPAVCNLFVFFHGLDDQNQRIYRISVIPDQRNQNPAQL